MAKKLILFITFFTCFIFSQASKGNEFDTGNSVRTFLTILNFQSYESGKNFCHVHSFFKIIGLLGASVETTANMLLKEDLLHFNQKLDLFKSKRPKNWKKDKNQISKAMHQILLSNEKKKFKMYRALSSLYLTNIALSLEIIENSNKNPPKIFSGCQFLGQNNHNIINEFKVNQSLSKSFYEVTAELNNWLEKYYLRNSKIEIEKNYSKIKLSKKQKSFVNTDFSKLSFEKLVVTPMNPFEHLFGSKLDKIQSVIKSNISPWNEQLSVFQVLILSSAAFISTKALSEFSKNSVKLIDSYIKKLNTEDPHKQSPERLVKFANVGCIDRFKKFDYYCKCKKLTSSTCFKSNRDELPSDLYGELDIGTLLKLVNKVFSGDYTDETFDKIHEYLSSNKITAQKVLTKINRQYVRIESLHPGSKFIRPKMQYEDVTKKLIVKFVTKELISSIVVSKGLVTGKENLETINLIESSLRR